MTVEEAPPFEVWECPDCGARYDSPIPIVGAMCSGFGRHKSKEMQRVWRREESA